MRKATLVVALVGAIGLAPVFTFAQGSAARAAIRLPGRTSAEHITSGQLRDYLSFIASDEMEGRDTPSRGLNTAAKFIATMLSRWGLSPAGDDGSFFQKIELSRDVIVDEKARLTLSGTAFAHGEGWFARPAAGAANAGLVYVSHGWVNATKNVDPYRGLDVKGKIVVAQLAFFPPGGSFQDLRRGSTWTRPAAAARDHGALAIVYVPTKRGFETWERLRTLLGTETLEPTRLRGPSEADIPAAVAGMALTQAIFAGEKSDAETIWKGFDSGTPVEGFALTASKTLALEVSTRSEVQWTQNVVAVWTGSDPVLKDQYVAFGAHYDHIGINDAPGAEGDIISNGADDDGSGTVALLAMAEALARTPRRPKRSVLFVWHCGEEKGLWGSEYFTDFPTIPLDRIVAQLNIDMIGRTRAAGDDNPRNAVLSGPHEVYAIGSKMMSDELGATSERVNDAYLKLQFNYKYDAPADPQRLFYRSDHFNYAKKGIPIIFFFSGLHEDYHRVSDQVEKIDFGKLQEVARTIYVLGWQLAESPTRPKVDRPLPATVVEAE